VHVTETCDVDQPHLIVHVATTQAPKSDVAMTEVIQADLQRTQRLPRQHLLDAGYINTDVLAQADSRKARKSQ
jgi:transposase